MKGYVSALRIALVVLAILGLSSPVAAGEQVPLKGSLSGRVTVTPVDPTTIDVLIEGTGNATHLGKFTLVAPHRVNLPSSTGSGSYEFTAANGDSLSASFTGVATFLSPDVVYIVETATITGGTGTFAGANGSFVCQRWSTPTTTIGYFTGTISKPGQ